MALTSETQPSPNGVNCIEHESAEILNQEDLEDGEIFEDEEPNSETKNSASIPSDKQKPENVSPEASSLQKKPNEPPKNQKSIENDKPVREQNVLFFNKAKRKHFDENSEEENRWKRDGKRHRRSHEFEREGEHGRTRPNKEPGEDDEDMMFVRGASPHRSEEDMDKWDREGDDEERMEMNRRPSRPFRGRGSMVRRNERQRGRGRGRGNILRGGKRKRDDSEMCMFFLQGKCHRGGDCPYSHDIIPPRKMELCKFYMKDCCAKKDKCLYMHSEFPCKYFHTGLKCYANKKCKFSHGQLTDSLRNVLAKHLDTAPKDILGEFPRRDRERGGDQRDMRVDLRDMRGDPRDMRSDPRDMRGDPRDMRNDQKDMRDARGEFMRNKNERERKIPSLFDIKVTIPEEMRSADGNHTPMPSPTQRSQDSTRSSDKDRENYSPDRERERERDRERDREKEYDREREHERQRHEKSERSKEKKAKKEKAKEHRKERKERREKEKEKKRERSKDIISEKNELLEHDGSKSSELMSPTHMEDTGRNCGDIAIPSEKYTEECDRRTLTYEENGLFPQHLPKKQRELFLRIQQQQREAESSQASANDEDEDMDKAAEENWYSSDEETAPTLPSILHNLTHNKQMTSSTAVTTGTTTATSSSTSTLLNLLATASAAAKPLDVNKTLMPTPFIPPNLDLGNLSTVFEALTNLQKMSSSANKTAEQQAVLTNSNEAVMEVPKIDLAKPEPPRVRDPRLREGPPRNIFSDIDIQRGSIKSQRRSSEGSSPSDVDLRSNSVSKLHSPTNDVDLRSLPFKPVQHSAASEIDASLTSHSPIQWHLIPAELVKPDYASLQIQPKPGVNDPRLRRVVRPPTDELGLPRDPRQRLVDEPIRDPRARQPLLATPLIPPTPLFSGPPPTPRYDEDHRQQFFRMDSDMRQFPPPTPRLEEDAYVPGPSRPVDPRQRNLGFEDPRRNQFPGRPDDVDLRTQLAHRVPFINFNK